MGLVLQLNKMAQPTICITKTVTLVPGESFVLPPNSTVIGASNVDGLTSTCADLDNLEQYSCFVAIVAAGGVEGNQSQYYEGNQSQIRGLSINGLVTSFTSIFKANNAGRFDSDLATILIEIKNASNQSIISTGTGISCGSGVRGCLTYILIKTIPSIANSLRLILGSDIPVGGVNTTIIVESQFFPIETLINAGYVNIPTCP